MNSKLWLYKAEMDLTSYSMTLLMAAQQQLHAKLEKNIHYEYSKVETKTNIIAS